MSLFDFFSASTYKPFSSRCHFGGNRETDFLGLLDGKGSQLGNVLNIYILKILEGGPQTYILLSFLWGHVSVGSIVRMAKFK